MDPRTWQHPDEKFLDQYGYFRFEFLLSVAQQVPSVNEPFKK